MRRASRLTALVLSLIFAFIFVTAALAADKTTSINDIVSFVTNSHIDR